MLESKNHQQISVSGGVLDLAFALRIPGSGIANVKSTPPAPMTAPVYPTGMREESHNMLAGVTTTPCRRSTSAL
jgi:hypothetical protein